MVGTSRVTLPVPVLGSTSSKPPREGRSGICWQTGCSPQYSLSCESRFGKRVGGMPTCTTAT